MRKVWIVMVLALGWVLNGCAGTGKKEENQATKAEIASLDFTQDDASPDKKDERIARAIEIYTAEDFEEAKRSLLQLYEEERDEASPSASYDWDKLAKLLSVVEDKAALEDFATFYVALVIERRGAYQKVLDLFSQMSISDESLQQYSEHLWARCAERLGLDEVAAVHYLNYARHAWLSKMSRGDKFDYDPGRCYARYLRKHWNDLMALTANLFEKSSTDMPQEKFMLLMVECFLAATDTDKTILDYFANRIKEEVPIFEIYSPSFISKYANALFLDGQYVEALDLYSQIIKESSGESSGFYKVSPQLFLISLYGKELLPTLTKQVKTANTQAERIWAYYVRGHLLQWTAMYPEALNDFLELKRLYDSSGIEYLLYANLGEIYEQLGQAEQAKEAYTKALESYIASGNKKNIALCLMALGRKDEAVALMKDLEQRGELTKDGFLKAVMLYAHIGDKAEAMRVLRIIQDEYFSTTGDLNSSQLDSIRETPEFQQLYRRCQEQEEQQRQILGNATNIDTLFTAHSLSFIT